MQRCEDHGRIEDPFQQPEGPGLLQGRQIPAQGAGVLTHGRGPLGQLLFGSVAPILMVKDTDYGFAYGARRPLADSGYQWRVTQWLAPCFSFFPPYGDNPYGGHAFGFMDPNDKKTRDTRFAEFLQKRESVLKWIKMYSPYEHVSKDDPPVYLIYNSDPAISQPQKDPTHTANYGVKLQEHCKAIGAECELVYPGAPDVKHKTIAEFLIEMLKKWLERDEGGATRH